MVPPLTEGDDVLKRAANILVTLGLCAGFLLWARAADAASDPARVICATFQRSCSYAVRIASCETGGTFDPRARGAAGERGWFQIHPVHFGRTLRSSVGSVRVDAARLYDPAYNVRVAYVLSNGGRDWQPWSCRRHV